MFVTSNVSYLCENFEAKLKIRKILPLDVNGCRSDGHSSNPSLSKNKEPATLADGTNEFN